MPSMLLRVIACRPGVLEDCLDIVIFQHDSSVVDPTFLSVLKLDFGKKSTYKCLRMFGIRACRQRIMRDIEATRRRLTVFDCGTGSRMRSGTNTSFRPRWSRRSTKSAGPSASSRAGCPAHATKQRYHHSGVTAVENMIPARLRIHRHG